MSSNPKPHKRRLLGDKYELSTLLGSGSYATVRRCLDLETKEEFAVKCLLKEHNGRDTTDMIDNEVKAIRSVANHPRVCQLHEIMVSSSKIYFIIDLASSSVLDKAGSEGHLTERRARYIFIQLVETIAYIHSRGVAHRDIKPSNLMLDQNGDLVLIDFGLSFVGDNLLTYDPEFSSFHRKSAVGSPHYAAPEVIVQQEGGYNPFLSDYWSIGVSLYVMLFGMLPFRGSIQSELFTLICSGNIQIPTAPKVSQDVIDILTNMICIEPTKRWTIKELRKTKWYQNGFVEATASFKSWLIHSPNNFVPRVPELPSTVSVIKSPTETAAKKPFTAFHFLKSLGCFDIHGPPPRELWDNAFGAETIHKRDITRAALKDIEEVYDGHSPCNLRCDLCEIDLTCPSSSYRLTEMDDKTTFFSNFNDTKCFDITFSFILKLKDAKIINFDTVSEIDKNHIKITALELPKLAELSCDMDFIVTPITERLSMVNIIRTRGDDLAFHEITKTIAKKYHEGLNSNFV